MDELFGFSTTTFMYILLVLLGISLLSVALVAIFNPIMFKVGVRNIPRRRAQTTLIVLGLMLSTIIISAAFTTGDTVDQSITSEVYGLLGSVDETINERSVDEDEAFNDPGDFVVADRSFSQADSAALIDSIARDANVDFVEPGYSDLAVAVNQEQRLSSPLFNLVGLDPTRARDLPDIEEVGGGRLSLSDLAPGEIYIDESAADELNVKKGETILLIVKGQRREFRVKAIVEDRWLAGAGGFSVRREGGVLPLALVQEIFGAQGRLTFIAISNAGDGHAGLQRTEDVIASVEPQLRALEARGGPNLAVNDTKRIGVDLAESAGNLFATIFIAFGLFSIGAGVLLIFMIFVMLAAERKPEMGMARAVGTKRFDIVQTFLSEGMTYNVLAAAVGTGLGVAVAFAMSKVMAAIFDAFDINITTHVTLKSLLISYSLGVVLTFLTVTFSSWRVSYINIVRAIRDIPEPPAQKPMWGSRGFFKTLGSLIAKPGSWKNWGGRVALVVLGVMFVATASPLFATLGGLCIVLAIFLTFRFGMLLFVGGVISLLVFVLSDSSSAFVLLFGLSLVPLGLALTVRSFGAPERLTYTLTGLVIIYVWEIDFSVGLIEKVFGEANGDIEMFFLSGLMVTVAATFLVVYNADIILWPLTRLGRWLGALLPSIKMAVAYPLANRARTGLTMAMFCLVVFALTMISAFNHNFNRLFISDRALGGYDVVVDENPTNPIADLRQALTAAGSPAVSDIDTVGLTSIVSSGSTAICQHSPGAKCQPGPGDDFKEYDVRGEDAGFFSEANIALQSRAKGFADDKAVWGKVASDPSYAIIDAFALPGNQDFGADAFTLEGIDEGSKEFEPVVLTLRDPVSGNSRDVTVIGIIELGSSASYYGLHVAEKTLLDVFGKPEQHRYFVKTKAGANNKEVAREIESALLTTGAQAESLRSQVDKQNAVNQGFFYLMQGFMGLGLFVGVAAVGVIAFRTVVERRQQIGMLRALGYTRAMVGLTFMIESAFIAFMGLISGIVFALILARQLITDQLANQGGLSFSVPWLHVLVIGVLAFGFALLMTLIPSRQAAGIPIAEALRYE